MEDKVWGEDCHYTTEMMFFWRFFFVFFSLGWTETEGTRESKIGFFGGWFLGLFAFQKVYIDFIAPFEDMF